MKLISDISPEGSVLSAYDLLNTEIEPLHVPSSIQPHGVLLVARQSDLRVVYASANAERITRIPVDAMLGASLLDCLSADITSRIIQYDKHKQLVFPTLRIQAVASNVGARHYFDVHQQNGFIFIEIELEITEPEIDHLSLRAQMLINTARSSQSLQNVLDSTVHGLRELTGYDRVMAYRFASDGHGHVVADDRARGMMSYKDLHFPASDIPAQLRTAHFNHHIEVVPNTRYEPIPLLSRITIDTDSVALDMTYCGLRSVSATRRECVRNMGVAATLTFSLIIDDQLWGLLICHHRAPKLPSPELRSTCELISQIVASLIKQRLKMDARTDALQSGSVMEVIASSLENGVSLFTSLVASSRELLEVVGASGAILRFNGQAQCIGLTPPLEEALDLMKALMAIEAEDIFASDCVSEVLPIPDSLNSSVKGVLMIVARGSSRNGILWFRTEEAETTYWAGNPDIAKKNDFRAGRVSGRKQFGRWKVLIEGRSRPWSEVDLRAANTLNRMLTAKLSEQVEDLAVQEERIDSLTMLPNRRCFQERLCRWGEDTDQPPAAIILVSIDRYNLVAAALGHAAADNLVTQVAHRVAALMDRESLTLARLDGDMFAVLCVGCTANEAENFSALISAILMDPFEMRGNSFHLTARLGIAHASHGSGNELMEEAETALHFAKQGASRSISFDKRLHETICERLEMEQDLYRAVERSEFILEYQPIVTLPENEIVAFEALLRWNHPVKGIISPLNFLEVAEEEGLILPIGDWVITEALRRISELRLVSGRSLRIYINLSPKQLAAESFVEKFMKSIFDCGLPPDAISIEVIENAMACETAIATLRELRELGVRVSIDDFGTGFSSLASLRTLPIDTVKIDKSFVHPIVNDGRSECFIAAILSLTQALGLKVIAEGVETMEQSELLCNMGCRFAQGYLFSKPLSIESVLEFMGSCSGTKLFMKLPSAQNSSVAM